MQLMNLVRRMKREGEGEVQCALRGATEEGMMEELHEEERQIAENHRHETEAS